MSNGEFVPRAATLEETLERIARAAQEYGDDFRVKVARKQTVEGMEQSVAIFHGARNEHFTAPETWLVPLAGGGPYYVLWIWPEKKTNVLVAILRTSAIGGPPHEVDIGAPARAGWSGPSTLIYPTASERAVGNPLPGGGTGPAASHTDRNLGGTPTGQPSSDGGLAAAQVSLLEARLRLETDALRNEAAAASKRMEQSLAQMSELVKTVISASQVPKAPEKSIAEQLAILAGAFAPIIAPLLTRGDSDRKFFAELESKREERTAQALESRDKLQAALMEKIGTQGQESAKTIAAMADVVGQSMRTQLQTLATLQDLRPGEPQEEPWVAIVRQAIATFGEISAAKVGAPAAPPALPPAQGNGAAPSAVAPAAPAAPQQEGIPLDRAEPQAIFDDLVEGLKAKEDAREMAEFYIEALKSNPGFVALVKQRGGTGKAFKAALGNWIGGEGNAGYLGSVFQALSVVAKENGVTV